MFTHNIEDVPYILTHAALDRYADYVVRRHNGELRPPRGQETETLTDSPSVPQTLEEALAPLELLYGKTFVSAVGIAIHGAEPVIRLVEGPDAADEDVHLAGDSLPAARCVYKVGEHILFSPYYCPCSAYAYQSVRRQEVWCCKHLLALLLALKLEQSGVPQDSLRSRVVPSVEYKNLLLSAVVF